MLRRLHPDQPETFAFTPANQGWAEGQISKYPVGRQASAVIPLLWRAQEQEGWVSRPAIEAVARMLDMAYIRVLEVATFYFMFQLQPVGAVAHVQVCGTTSCMLCGAEDLIRVCREKIAAQPHALSPDGRFSWEEVECLGACSNAPMAQIGKDYYEDLTAASFAGILDAFARGELPAPGPQNGRFASEPRAGGTSLAGAATEQANASVTLARRLGDTVARITGDAASAPVAAAAADVIERQPPAAREPDAVPAGADAPSAAVAAPRADAAEAVNARVRAAAREAGEAARALAGMNDPVPAAAPAAPGASRPAALAGPRGGIGDDLKRIKGVGPRLEKLLHGLGIYHFDQIAAWTATEIAWMDAHLEGFSGRVSREDWVGQSKVLAAGGGTKHALGADKGEFD